MTSRLNLRKLGTFLSVFYKVCHFLERGATTRANTEDGSVFHFELVESEIHGKKSVLEEELW